MLWPSYAPLWNCWQTQFVWLVTIVGYKAYRETDLDFRFQIFYYHKILKQSLAFLNPAGQLALSLPDWKAKQFVSQWRDHNICMVHSTSTDRLIEAQVFREQFHS